MTLPHYGTPNPAKAYYHQSLLDNYRDSCKTYTKKIRWNKIYIGICIFNTLSFTINTLYHINHWYSLIYGICAPMWLVIAYFTTKTIKNDKLTLKANRILYEEELKIVDYPRYIKEQRTKKLKKLKKAKLKS